MGPLALVLTVALMLPAGAAGAGDPVPGDAVATVGAAPITNVTFAHWMFVAAASEQHGAGADATSKPVVPVPPDYTTCIAAARAAVPKGAKHPSEARLRTQCRQQYRTLRNQVMQFLISAQWIVGEAESQGIAVTDAQVRAAFARQKQQSYPKEADFRRFLKTSGLTRADLLLRVKVDMLSTRLSDKILDGAPKPSPAQIAACYAKHKGALRTPSTRDVRIVLTRTRALARAARRALAHASFAGVARKYSIDRATRYHGGVLRGLTRGEEGAVLDKAVFAAAKERLYGPLRTRAGWYVFRVTRITPSAQLTLQQATPQITAQLTQNNAQDALDAFVVAFTRRWRGRTTCRSGFVVASCGNAPKGYRSFAPAAGAMSGRSLSS